MFSLNQHDRDKDKGISNQAESHINTLNRLKQKLEDHQEIKLRTLQYRQLKKDFMKKKEYVIGGNKIENYRSTSIPSKVQMNEDESTPDSLKQLAELEKRISALETSMVEKRHPNHIVHDRLLKFQSHHKPLKSVGNFNYNKPSHQYSALKNTGPQTERFKPKYGHHYLEKVQMSKESSRNQKRGIFLTQTENEYDDEIDNEDMNK